MAFSLQITAVRASTVQVQPATGASGAGYTLLVSYALCSGKAGAYTDVLVGRGERTMEQSLVPGHPMPVQADLAALIRQDCQMAFGGQPDVVLIAGQSY